MDEGERMSARMPPALRDLRVAIVHDYLNQQGGAEKVVEVFADMFPAAPIYVSVYDRAAMPDRWARADVRTTFLERLSPKVRWAKALLPLYPAAFESLDLGAFDLVLSSTTAFAKGVITRPHTLHVCYCNNPARFLWTYEEYVRFEPLPWALRHVLPLALSPLRVWDFAAAQRVDRFIAGSYNAARRIAKYYRRDSVVLQPPIDVDSFQSGGPIGEHFLVVARLQPYKRLDLAVEACTRLGIPLHVVGAGPDEARLRRTAGPTVRFLGRLPDSEMRAQLAACRALIVPGEEDFGLTPLEAQASGRPVIAYGAGGALETVRDGETGILFRQPSVDAVVDALATFRDDRFHPEVLRRHARRFDRSTFVERLYDILADEYEAYQDALARPE